MSEITPQTPLPIEDNLPYPKSFIIGEAIVTQHIPINFKTVPPTSGFMSTVSINEPYIYLILGSQGGYLFSRCRILAEKIQEYEHAEEANLNGNQKLLVRYRRNLADHITELREDHQFSFPAFWLAYYSALMMNSVEDSPEE